MRTARAFLTAAGSVWVIFSLGGFVLAAVGASWLVSTLPPLAVGPEAVGGAVAASSAAALGIGLAHLGALLGMRRATSWAPSAAILLCGVLAVAFVALAVAALTTAARQPTVALGFVTGAVAAFAVAAGYALAGMGLVRFIRAVRRR